MRRNRTLLSLFSLEGKPKNKHTSYIFPLTLSIPCCLVQLPGSHTSIETDCAICSDGYTEGLGFTCNKCSNTSAGVALMVVVFAVIIVVIVFLVLYLISGELELTRRGFVKRLLRYIPLQSIKIIIVAWQILTQVRPVTAICSTQNIWYTISM